MNYSTQLERNNTPSESLVQPCYIINWLKEYFHLTKCGLMTIVMLEWLLKIYFTAENDWFCGYFSKYIDHHRGLFNAKAKEVVCQCKPRFSTKNEKKIFVRDRHYKCRCSNRVNTITPLIQNNVPYRAQMNISTVEVDRKDDCRISMAYRDYTFFPVPFGS